MAHGPLDFKQSPGVTAARKALAAAKRPPTDDDRPPPSLFPMTRAARVAKERSQADNRGRAR